MFTLAESAFEIMARTALIYVAILVGLRLAGKREIGQMTIFDLVVLLLLANAVQNAMVGTDTSVLGGILAAGTLLGINAIVAYLRLRSPRLRHIIEGSPTLLILHGKIISENAQREGIDHPTLEAALREHGVEKVSDVEIAVLELDGMISVVPINQEMKRVKRPPKSILKA
jgi:uncharacterized membrane protein YcaP (DUF421 family)